MGFSWRKLLTTARATLGGESAAAPIVIESRDVADEGSPLGGGIETFDTPEAGAINRARLAHLDSLGLPLSSKRVLDVGCGVGHHGAFYAERGCSVLCVDAREENIRALRRRYPQLEAHVADVETDDLSRLGNFDIVHCYGLLYHLENPLAALRNIAAVCQGILLLETIVCDHPMALLRIEDETLSSNQALGGLGCRPSPGFVAMALNRVGFPFVYAPRRAPDHEDFAFERRGNLDTRRDGHNLRCVFLGSKAALSLDGLEPLVRSP